MNRPDCAKCPWVKPIPGNHHISCNHPIVEIYLAEHPVYKLLEFYPGAPINIPFNLNGTQFPTFVCFSTHGVYNGWASWPCNFDPTWLELCVDWEIRSRPKLSHLAEVWDKLWQDKLAECKKE